MESMQEFETLNEKQKEAVSCTKGPLLIVAGAGAGKTKTLTYRIINLIHKGVDPSSILAITFTNKAAKEMRDRVEALLEKIENGGFANYRAGGVPFVSTFHALGVYIIKENANLLGLTKHFTILDDADSISIIKDIMKANDINPKIHEPRKIRNIISRAKGDLITWDKFNISVKSSVESITALIWREYNKRLKKDGSLDFDDLLLKTAILLKKYPEIKNKYRQKWQYIHIDEYQDTNEVQYEMAKLLVGKDENICVVGDTDQNIYSWRGANIKNMLHFEKDYPNAKIIILEQNYRSTKKILEAANTIINKNKYRVPKNLFTENKEGETINVCEAYDEVSEAKFVAEMITELIKKKNPEDIAILYRANFQSRVLEEALLQTGIPYQVLGVKFFERKEIKDTLSYIKAAYNQNSWSDIKRIINVPTRGIGKVTLAKLFSGKFDELPEKMKGRVNNFYSLLEEVKNYSDTHKASETIKFIIKKTGLEDKLEKGTSDEQEALENIKELVTLATKYDSSPEGIEELLENASLASEQDSLIHKDKNKKGVKLMTVHAAKGLEFKYVFITGLEQDLFPHTGNFSRPKEDQEEERRLFYVAMTRAEEKLFLTYATLRTLYGSRQVNSPSEFIYDIPEELTTFEQYGGNSKEKIVYL